MQIRYIREPTDLQCGQAVLAMLLGKSADEIVRIIGNERETTLREMTSTLRAHGVQISDVRLSAESKSDLPDVCLLSLETPRCWHWSLFCGGVFYDPEHGVMDDFPQCRRKYYWEIHLPERGL